MNRRFWLGVITGIITAAAAHRGLIFAVTTIIRRADMAEERTWTQNDDYEWYELLADANGQLP